MKTDHYAFIQNGKRTSEKLKAETAATERELQKLVEENLLPVLDIHFLATEYVTSKGGRIDTFGVDTSGAPVIIEYKKGRDRGIIVQGSPI